MEELNGTDLPVIDLSLFSSKNVDQNQLESHEFNKLRQACQELGFFLVINHGVDATLIQSVECRIRDMFALPAEIKNRAIFPIFNTGYGPSVVDDVAKDSIPENMSFPWDHLLPNSVEKISAKLWPQGNPAFCEELNAYGAQIKELSHRILKLLVWSLGVDVSSQSASELFEKSFGNVRMNYYDKCTDKEMISKAHTDVSFFTILYQDDIGGLQIRTKQGKWMDSKPLPGSFVINVGDILQIALFREEFFLNINKSLSNQSIEWLRGSAEALRPLSPTIMWSNGRNRSAEHRVVYGRSNRNRLSMAYFFDLPDEFEIRCPKEMIDQEHPQLYKVVTKGDTVAYFKKVGPNMATPQHFRLQ
ncbi:oxoglutarate-dependent flavonoid 7-O-demethylase 1-like [Cryptomeria japonica]|uniref:oxoglutarate-dependent flavonoid 7-O-demethylase 1-like n=1 Tax=Cryptomeria japonica TaxID=3369 RepID=UPI0027D9E34D|nr:oxoglutarate-dependent flavonoid 7-O-demethylase 1-like [Cryptomeria japonica]